MSQMYLPIQQILVRVLSKGWRETERWMKCFWDPRKRSRGDGMKFETAWAVHMKCRISAKERGSLAEQIRLKSFVKVVA